VASTRCSFRIKSGLSGGSLGKATLPLGKPILTRQDCCEACGKHTECSQFTWVDDNHECLMYPTWAETYVLPLGDMITGVLDMPGSSSSFTRATSPPPSTYFYVADYTPSAPSFVTLTQTPPPPPPDQEHDDSGRTKEAIAFASRIIIGAMVLVALCFTYAFFSVELLEFAHRVSGGRYGRLKGLPGVAKPVPAIPEADVTFDKHGKQRIAVGRVKVIIEMSNVKLNQVLDISFCDSASELKELIFDEFASVLRDVNPKHALLLCQASGGRSPSRLSSKDVWMLISDNSNIKEVRKQCEVLKLLTTRQSEGDYAQLAFPKDASAKKKKKKEPLALPVPDAAASVDASDDPEECTSFVGSESCERGYGERGEEEAEESASLVDHSGYQQRRPLKKGKRGNREKVGGSAHKTASERLKHAVCGRRSGKSINARDDSSDEESATSCTQLVSSSSSSPRGPPGLEIVRATALREPSAVSGWEDDDQNGGGVRSGSLSRGDMN